MSRLYRWMLGGALMAGLWFPARPTLAEAPPAVSLVPPVVASTAPAEPAYVYHGDRFRDPFLPLTGGPNLEVSPMSTTIQPFNPVGLELKGILKTSTGRWAVLRASDGATYLVQNGKIYDPKRKVVEGFQGIVKERTLILLGPKDQEMEIHLKRDEEAKKGKP